MLKRRDDAPAPIETHRVVESIDALDWRDDRVVLHDLVLRLQSAPADPSLEMQSLAFFKTRPLVDEYRKFFAAHPDFTPRRVFELGIWDGGSAVFWYEVLQPEKLIAVDLAERGDDPLFEKYVASRNAADRIETHWRTDQRDAPRLRALAERFSGPLDLIVDDASHTYVPTRTSFETLFPLLRPGGVYVIEDWAWGHWPEYRSPGHPWHNKTPLTPLVHDLVELQGAAPALLAGLTINHEFVAVERGAGVIDDASGFTLDKHLAGSE